MSETSVIVIQIKPENVQGEAGKSLAPISEVFKTVVGFKTTQEKSKYCIRAVIPSSIREEFEEIATAKGYSVRSESSEDRQVFEVPTGTGIPSLRQ